MIGNRSFEHEAFVCRLEAAQAHVASLGNRFSHVMSIEAYNERRTEDSTAAQEVFHVPEPLEVILDHLNIPDLLAFSQMNKGIKAAVDSSVRLQTHLCLRAMPPNSHLRTPLDSSLLYSIPVSHGNDSWSAELASLPARLQFIGFSCRIKRIFQIGFLEPDTLLAPIEARFDLLHGQRLPKMGEQYRRSMYSNE